MNRLTPIPTTNESLSALLYHDEEHLVAQPGVGLYDGKDKSPSHQDGTIHLTSHRLIYVDAAAPHARSLALDLSATSRTEYYAGFLKSSPKITLVFVGPSASSAPENSESAGAAGAQAEDEDGLAGQQGWTCNVCSFVNPPTKASAPRCTLCGVARDIAWGGTRAVAAPSPSHHPRPSSSPPTTTAIPPALAPVPSADGLIFCPTCTFLNHPSMAKCEMCDTPLGTHSPAVPSRPRTLAAGTADSPNGSSRPVTPGGSVADSIKLSFRRGGDKALYAALKRALGAKVWARDSADPLRERPRRPDASGAAGADEPEDDHVQAGINGILASVSLTARSRDTGLHSALSDLEALMSKAADMVSLAESLAARLPAHARTSADAEAETLVRSSLVRLGLPSPAVTQDMVRDEDAYHAELARELGGLLQGEGGIMGRGKDARGVVGLDEVWCVWNRARGVALVPPKSLLSAASHLPQHTAPPIHLRIFRSGLRVLHTPPFSHASFSARLLATHLPKRESNLSLVDLARAERLSSFLVGEMVEGVEAEEGAVVRDEDGRGEVRWWRNEISREWERCVGTGGEWEWGSWGGI